MFRKLTLAAAMAASALVAFVPGAASAHGYDRDRPYYGRVYQYSNPRYYHDRRWIGRDRWEHRRWQEARRRHWEHERWERHHDRHW